MKQEWKRLVPGMTGARQIALLLLTVISLSLAGFAHRAAPLQDGEPPQTAFQLPDGTQLSICLAGETSDHGEHDGHCEFCRIASASHAIDGAPQLAFFERPGSNASQRFSTAPATSIRWRTNTARAPPSAA